MDPIAVPARFRLAAKEAQMETSTDCDKGAAREAESKALRLFHQDRYAPDDAAYLLGVPVETIYQAAFAKQLDAEIVGHDVVAISREALLRWLRDGHDGGGNDR
jgi:hypothetical protein